MENEINNKENTDSNNNYSNNTKCFFLFLTVCLIFLSYFLRFPCNTRGYNSDIKRPLNISKIIFYNENIKQKSCSICLEEYKKNEKIFLSNCEHIFHSKCINSWLNNNITCPICRQILS